MQKMSLCAIGTPVSGPPSPCARRSSAARASPSARSAVTVTKAFRAGAIRSMRPRKCRVRSRLENRRALRPAASSATVSVCSDMTGSHSMTLGTRYRPAATAAAFCWYFSCRSISVTTSGRRRWDLVRERVRHGHDAAGVGRRELLDEVDDAGEALDVDGQLRLGDLEAGEVGDALDLGARQTHGTARRTGKNRRKSYTSPCRMS